MAMRRVRVLPRTRRHAAISGFFLPPSICPALALLLSGLWVAVIARFRVHSVAPAYLGGNQFTPTRYCDPNPVSATVYAFAIQAAYYELTWSKEVLRTTSQQSTSFEACGCAPNDITSTLPKE